MKRITKLKILLSALVGLWVSAVALYFFPSVVTLWWFSFGVNVIIILCLWVFGFFRWLLKDEERQPPLVEVKTFDEVLKK